MKGCIKSPERCRRCVKKGRLRTGAGFYRLVILAGLAPESTRPMVVVVHFSFPSWTPKPMAQIFFPYRFSATDDHQRRFMIVLFLQTGSIKSLPLIERAACPWEPLGADGSRFIDFNHGGYGSNPPVYPSTSAGPFFFTCNFNQGQAPGPLLRLVRRSWSPHPFK